MQLTKTVFPNSAIFIEKKSVENRLWGKSAFLCVGGEMYHAIMISLGPAKSGQASGSRTASGSVPKARALRRSSSVVLVTPSLRSEEGNLEFGYSPPTIGHRRSDGVDAAQQLAEANTLQPHR